MKKVYFLLLTLALFCRAYAQESLPKYFRIADERIQNGQVVLPERMLAQMKTLRDFEENSRGVPGSTSPEAVTFSNGGQFRVATFQLPQNESLVLKSDLLIWSEGDVTIDGNILGEVLQHSNHAGQDLIIGAAGTIFIRGAIALSDGGKGSDATDLPGNPALLLSHLGSAALLHTFGKTERWQGGDGGSLLLHARRIVYEGKISVGHGGTGYSQGKGGDGGMLALIADQYEQMPFAQKLQGGEGGRGGNGIGCGCGDGGAGGTVLLACTPGMDGAHDSGTGEVTGGNGGPGGDGSAENIILLSDLNGCSGGIGGNGISSNGNGRGGKGGDGGNSALIIPGVNGVIGGNGGAGGSGVGGNGGAGYGGDGGKGGDGGQGRNFTPQVGGASNGGSGGHGGNGGNGTGGYGLSGGLGQGGNGGNGGHGGHGGDDGPGNPASYGANGGNGGHGGFGGVGSGGNSFTGTLTNPCNYCVTSNGGAGIGGNGGGGGNGGNGGFGQQYNGSGGYGIGGNGGYGGRDGAGYGGNGAGAGSGGNGTGGNGGPGGNAGNGGNGLGVQGVGGRGGNGHGGNGGTSCNPTGGAAGIGVGGTGGADGSGMPYPPGCCFVGNGDGINGVTGAGNQQCPPSKTCVGGACVGTVLPVWYQDSDGDSYGNPTASIESATQPAGYVVNNLDCDDNPATGSTIYPGAPEICDNLDNNCDGLVDYVNFYYWNGTLSSGNWTDATNWIPHGVPGPGDYVSISNSCTVTLNVAPTIASLFLEGNLDGANDMTITCGLTIINGVLGNTGNTVVGGDLVWEHGTIGSNNGTASGTVTVNGMVFLTNNNGRNLFKKTLVCNSGLNWLGGRINLGFGSILRIPSGTTLTASLNSENIDNSGGDPSTLDLQGNFVRNTGTGVVAITAVSFNPVGTTTVSTGTLRLGNGSTFAHPVNIASGAMLELGSGTHELNAVTFSGGGALFPNNGVVNVNSGTVIPAGMISEIGYGTFTDQVGLTYNDLTLVGTYTGSTNTTITGNLTLLGVLGNVGNTSIGGILDWQSGYIGNATGTATGTVTVTGLTTLSTNNSRGLFKKTLVCNSGANWAGGRINLGHGSIFRIPAGTTLTASLNSENIDDSGGDPSTLDLQGNFVRSTGTGVVRITAVPFNPAGTTTINTGSVRLVKGSTFTNIVSIAQGATLELNNGTHSLNGEVRGNGALDIVGGTFTNNGSFAPGLSPGILTVTRANGVPVHDLNIEIQSESGAGVGHDQLQIPNAVTMDGNLHIALLNGFVPTVGNSYTILTYASFSGAFSSVSPSCWTVHYGPTSAYVTYNPPAEICDGLDNDCDGQIDEGVEHPDYAALMALYNATDGANWTDNTGWGATPCDVCGWYGVGCDLNGRVVSIELIDNNLTGNIPPEIGDLEYLEQLKLINNNLSGNIQIALTTLPHLQYLYLGANQFTGPIPPELGNLSNLLGISFLQNQLTGSLPAELGNLTNLTELDFQINQLTGPIPTELGNLPNLYFVALGNNQLSGNIPASFANLSNLEVLDLSINQLSGSIPVGLGGLGGLKTLLLNENQLTGPIPAALGNLSNLDYLALNNNQLSGKIPASLGNLSGLLEIFLQDNQLTGCFPSALASLCPTLYDFSNNAGLPGGGNFAAFCADGTGVCPPPVAVCKNITVQLDPSQVTVPAAALDGGSTGGTGAFVFSISGSPSVWYDCSAVGSHAVTLTVTDANSNIAQCAATISVQDVTPPTITCPASVTVCANPAINQYVGTSVLNPTVTDNCSTLANVSYLFTGATTNPLPNTTVPLPGTAAGKAFNLNATTIQYTVTDAGGSSSCSLQLTVRKSPWPYWQPPTPNPPVPVGAMNLKPYIKDKRSAAKTYKIYLGAPTGTPVCTMTANNGMVSAGQNCWVTHSTPGLYQYYAVAINDYATGLDCEFVSVAFPVTVVGPGQTSEGGVTLDSKELGHVAPVLFPNPTDGLLNVLFEENKQDSLSMMFYDTNGRLVMKSDGTRPASASNAAAGIQQFDLSQLAGGVYLFRLVVGSQQYTGRVIKID